jgi:4-hydroxy-tetrahydrodipicolinate synthase
MLSHDERIDVFKSVQQAARGKPALLTVAEAATRDACRLAERGAKAGASGLMVVPSTIYHTNREETLAALRAVAEASDLPIMVYSNRVAYRVDVTNEMLLELSEDRRFVAVKESSDDIRRTTSAIALLGDRMDIFTGVDNLAFEALSVGAVGWIAGLVTAFPCRGARDLSLVPAIARPRRFHLPRPEHQARRGAGDRHQRARPPAEEAARRSRARAR